MPSERRDPSLAVLIDDLAGSDCWIDLSDETTVVVVVDGHGIGNEYPFVLDELWEAAMDLLEEQDEDD